MNKGLLVLLICVSSCAPSRFIEPLDKGEQAVSFNVGGSLIEYADMTIPVPLTSLTYGNGLTEKLTVFGSLHTTSLIFNNFQTEVGVVSHIRNQERWIPALSSSLALNFITELSKGNAKLWPQIDGNAYWNLNANKHRLHLGYSIWIDTQMLDENRIGIINPHFGYTYKMKTYELGTELKLLAPGTDNSKVFLPYQIIMGDRGATGIYLTLTKRF
jgi:hypothetical protein